MSTNVKRATRKGLLPDYLLFNISDYIQYYSRIFFKNVFCSFLFSLQHGGQIRSSSIDIYLSGLLARRQNAWSQDGGNMRVIANGVNR